MTDAIDAADRLRRLHALFDRAVDLPTKERELLLTQSAGDDAELVTEVRLLIEAEKRDAGVDADSVLRQLDHTLKQLLPDALTTGLVVGAYRVEAEIGAGGMGRVFRARRDDPTMDHEVAIKVVRRDMMTGKALMRFESERAVLARLRHPGICQFLDAGRLSDGSPYFVMELLNAAVPITTFADREQLTIAARLALFSKVVTAVQYAHQNLIVHRDIKASNVLVLPDGQPKLLDFGIAKSIATDTGEHATATADRFFSIASAAPEQLVGAAVTVGCDIYSLGVLLYELLSSVPPFDAATTSLPVLIEQIANRIPAPMHAAVAKLGSTPLHARHASSQSLRRALVGDIEDIVQRCLRKTPQERYQSVDALASDLRCVQLGLPISIRGGQSGYRLRKFILRHRMASALATALLLSLVASAWIVAAQNLRIRTERDQAREALAILRDAFLSADPARMGGDTVTARQVMDSAYTTLERKIDRQPVAFLDLMATMAEVELSLDGSERALHLTSRAMQTIATISASDELRQRIALLHASALSGTGEQTEAQALLEAMHPVLPQHRIEWLNVQGRNLTAAGDFVRAEHLLRDVVALTSAADPRDRAANRARLMLADNLSRRGDPGAALVALDAMTGWHRGDLRADHPYLLLADLQRATALRKLDRNDEAIEIARGAAALADATYGSTSAMAARANMTLGNVLLSLEDYRGAESSLRRSRDALERILGRTHPSTARAQFNLAVALDAQSPPSASTQAELKRAWQDARASAGPQSKFAATVTLQYARHLAGAGAASAARQLLTDADFKAALASNPSPELVQSAAEVEAAVVAAERSAPAAIANGRAQKF